MAIVKFSTRAALSIFALCFVLVPGFRGSPVQADDGDLDPTFWSDGKLVMGGGDATVRARAATAAPDGMAVYGFLETDDLAGLKWRRFDGTDVDTACRVELGGDEIDSIAALDFDSQGRLLVVGTLEPAASVWTGFVARFLYPDCDLDESFDTDGWTEIEWSPTFDDVRLSGIAVQSNDKIVVAGTGTLGSDDDAVAFRLETGGGLDPNFATLGRWRSEVLLDDSAADVIILPGGNLLVVGSGRGATEADFRTTQLTAGGTLRLATLIAFNLGTPGTGEAADVCTSAALDARGGVILAGNARTGPDDASHAAIARLKPDAAGLYQPDATFGGGDAKVDFNLGNGAINRVAAVVVQGDGKILVAGSSWDPSESVYAIARRLANGGPDSSFGIVQGLMVVDFDAEDGTADHGYDLLLQSGRPVVVGEAQRATLSPGAGLTRLTNAYIFADGFEWGSSARWALDAP